MIRLYAHCLQLTASVARGNFFDVTRGKRLYKGVFDFSVSTKVQEGLSPRGQHQPEHQSCPEVLVKVFYVLGIALSCIWTGLVA